MMLSQTLMTLLMISAYLAIQSPYVEIAAERHNQWLSCVGKVRL
jgi:hypothetical protein